MSEPLSLLADLERRAADKGVDLKAVSKTAKVAHTTVSRWRKGKNEPSMRIYRRLVQAIDVAEPKAAA